MLVSCSSVRSCIYIEIIIFVLNMMFIKNKFLNVTRRILLVTKSDVKNVNKTAFISVLVIPKIYYFNQTVL